MNEVKNWSGKRWLAFLIQLVIVLLVLFGKWLGYSLNYFFGSASDSTTLLGVGKLLSDLGNMLGSYGEGSAGVTILAILIYALLALCAWMCIRTFLSIFKSDEIKPSGFTYGIVLFAVILLLVMITNGAIKSETDGYISKLFTVGAPAYFTLVLSVIGLLVCKKMPDNAPVSIPKIPHTAKPAAAVTAAPARFCSSCGAAIRNPESLFCTACGAKLEEEPHCPKCGKKLDANMRFCPSCGTDCAPKTPEASSVTQE